MKISRHDWDTQQVVYDEYPDSLFQPLLDWLVNTQAWIDEPRRVVDKVNVLRRKLLEYRTPAPTHHETIEPSAADLLAADRKATQRAHLAKARAKRAANVAKRKEAQHAEA